MLSAFSWGDFAQCTLIILLCYYLAIGVVLYRAELLSILSGLASYKLGDFMGRNDRRSNNETDEKNAKEKRLEREQQSFEVKRQISTGTDLSKVYVELEEAINIGKLNKITRVEILNSIEDIINRYKNTIDKDVAETVNQLVQSQLNINSYQPLTDEEQEWLWLN